MTVYIEKSISELSFRAALHRLDAAGLLLKVNDEVDWNLELTSILNSRPGQAMLFNHVKGCDMPVMGNLMGSEENVLAICKQEVIGLRQFIAEGLANPVPPMRIASGQVQEVVYENPDITGLLPLPRYTPNDGGRYISAGVVIAKDSATGIYNASYHRFMHVGGNRLLINIDPGRHLGILWQNAKTRGEPLPIAVVLGPDIGILYAGAITGAQLPFDMDEYHVASGIQHRSIELVKGLTVPLDVPAHAEVVLEGFISSDDEMDEGPFMDFIGLYTAVSPSPVVTITCLCHRRDPIWPVVMNKENSMLGKPVYEGVLMTALKSAAPCVTDVALTAGGIYRFHLNVAVKKGSAADEGYQRNAIYAAITAMRAIDRVVVVDDDIDIRDPNDVEWALATRWNASKGLILMPGSRGNEMVPISEKGVRTKVGIDATLPYGFSRHHKRIPMPPVDLSDYETSLEPVFISD